MSWNGCWDYRRKDGRFENSGLCGKNDMSVRTIDECFYQIRNGANIKQGAVDGGYPITRIETTANDRFNRDRMGYAGITDIKKYENYVLQDGDLLMSHINSTQYLGRTVLYEKQGDEKIIHGMNLLGLKARRDIIIPAYARYCFYSQPFREQIGRITKKSVNQASFAVADLKKIKIIVPDLSEQCEVIDILNRVNQVIEDRQRELRKMDDLIKARFVEMFGDPVANEKGWTTKPLLDMGKCKNGMNFHYDDKGIEINCLGVGDFKNLSIIDNTEELPTILLNEMPSEEYLLKDDDIVFVRSNGNKALVGRSLAVYPGDVPTTFSGFCIRYRKHDNEITVPYLLRVLKTDSMRMKMAGRGANIQNLNQQILGTLVIPVPPVELQNQFAAFVTEVNKSKVKVQKALDETQKLFDSLMQQYFG